MKKIFLFVLFTISFQVISYTQITYFGLEGMKVTEIRVYNDTLFAATLDSGVYHRDPNTSEWTCVGLKGENINCVYPHKLDSRGFSLSVGISTYMPGDTAILYSLSSDGWVPDDSGMNPSLYDYILSIDGFTYPGNVNLMFAAGYCYAPSLFRRSNIAWEKIPSYSPKVVRFSPIGDVWVGSGEGCAEALKSTDRGNTWTWLYLENPCVLAYVKDIAFHPSDLDIVYVGGLFGIEKTTDGGLNWQNVGGGAGDLSIDPFDGDHVFAGSSYSGWLFETTDGGLSWDTIPRPVGAQYTSDLKINVTDLLELYIATNGTGVYRLTQPSSACGRMINVNEGWNMISIPNKPYFYSTTSIFPSSTSSAFIYQGSYMMEDTLENGEGYWLKFDDPEVISLIGERIHSDTITVSSGWNMIGSISYAVPVSLISIDPLDMIVSEFFTYKDNQYVSSDTIQPGQAYWVKTNKSGKLILDTTSSIMTSRLIKMVPDGELPPPPPGDYQIKLEELPKKFALEQNYPNPFNPTTVISYQLPAESWVTLKVYNIFGQEIITLVNSLQQAGYKSVQFDAKAFASGVYLYHLHAVGIDDPKRTFSYVKKMIVLK